MQRRAAQRLLWRQLSSRSQWDAGVAAPRAAPGLPPPAATAAWLAAAGPVAGSGVAVPEPGTFQHGWRLAIVTVLGLAASASSALAEDTQPPPPDQSKGFHLMSLDQRRRMFFKYEKKIREFSPPEKVFEYFASLRHGKVFSMTAGDMLRSVVPVFPPEGSEIIRAGSLPGEPSPHLCKEEASPFIQKFDIDGDAALGFEEYQLFRTLLAIPLEDLEVAFRIIDRDGNGSVDRAEFQQLVDSIHARSSKPIASMRESVKAAAERAAAEGDEAHGLMLHFFGKDGKRKLSLAAFSQFVCDLREELLRLEFKYYDWQGKGVITGRDMAYSIISCARMKHTDQYLEKVLAMPADLASMQITFSDFKQFRDMWKQLRLLSVALEFQHNMSGRVRRQDFIWTVQHVLAIQLDPKLVDILFYLFGGKDDTLNINYMYEVMNRHYTTGLEINYKFTQPNTSKSFTHCLRECMGADS